MKLKEWLDKGEGGYSWYEPYVTNRDLVDKIVLMFYILCYKYVFLN